MTAEETPKQPDAPEETAAASEPDEPTFAPSETAAETILEVAEPTATEDEAPQAPEVDPAAEAEARVAELEEQVADLNDKLLRALAETENVRRRAQRDKEDASKFAIKGFAEDMLRVSDNLGRALSSIDAEARAADSNMENLAVGVEMVNKELLSAFERAGLKPIEAMGARFDPMLHEAMFEIQDPDQPAGTVAQVMEDGFTLHGRTLRAAKVGVTKGGPKVAAPKESEEGGEAEEPAADPTQREGQQAYEAKGDVPPEAGGQVDQEL